MGQIPSPVITDISWGRMVVEGLGGGRDFKLWPWVACSTRHVDGVTPNAIHW